MGGLVAAANLEVVLQLSALFGGPAAQAAESLDKIADKIDDLGSKAGVFGRLNEAALELQNTLRSVGNQAADLGLSVETVGRKTESASRSARDTGSAFSNMGSAARSAAQSVSQMGTAAESLGASASRVRDVAAGISDVGRVSEQARQAFEGLIGAVDQTDKGSLSALNLATRQLEAGATAARGAFRDLREEIAQLNAAAVGMTRPSPYTALPGSNENRAVPVGGVSALPNYGAGAGVAIRAARANEAFNTPIDASFTQRSPYDRALTGGARTALPSGTIFEAEFDEIAAGFRRIQAEAKAAAAAAGQIGAFTTEAGPRAGINPGAISSGGRPGAIVPYTFTGQAEEGRYVPPDDAIDAQFRTSRAGDYFNRGRDFDAEYAQTYSGADNIIGATIGRQNAANAAMSAEERAARMRVLDDRYRAGDQRQSAGFAGMYNAEFVGSMAIPAFQNQARVTALDAQNEIAARANDAGPQAVAALQDFTHALPGLVGLDRTQAYAGTTGFLSSMPQSVDLNNPEWMKTAMYGMDRAAKLSVISTQSGAPLDVAHANIGLNQAITNLGYDTSSPQALGKAQTEMSNMLAKMKNVTPSGIGDTLAFLKAVGPVAALDHQAPEDMAGLIYELGKGKMIGGPAGNATKRLFQRETLPTPATKAVQEYMAMPEHGGVNLDLFDKKGHARAAVDVIGDFANADMKHHYSDQVKSMVVGQLSGLYANSQVGQLLNTMEQHGGTAGLRKEGDSLLHKGIAGSKKDAVESEYGEQAKHITVASAKAAADMGEAWGKVFKDIEPGLVALANFIDKVAVAFGNLNPYIRDGAAGFVLIGTGLLAAGSLFGILSGNLEKSAAAFSKFALNIKNGEGLLGGFINGIARAGGAIFGFITNFAKTAIIEPLIGAMAVAWEAFVGVIAATTAPVWGAIALGVAVVGGLYLAWKSNLFNCQSAFAAFSAGVREKVGEVVSWFQWLEQAVGKMVDGVRGALSWVWGTISTAVSKLDDAFGGIGKRTMGFIGNVWSHGVDLAHKAGTAFGNAVGAGVNTAKAKIGEIGNSIHGLSGNLGKIIMPGAYAPPAIPKTPAPGSIPGAAGPAAEPATDMPSNMADDLYKAIHGHGKKKQKKGKKPHDDTSIDIGDLSATDVEAAARKLEEQWKKYAADHHVKLHVTPADIDLKNAQGQILDHVYGFTKAYRAAIESLKPDAGLREKVNITLEHFKFFGTSVEQQVQKLEAFLKKAKTEGLKAYIESQIAAINAKEFKSSDEAKTQYDKTHTAIFGEDGTAKSPTGGLAESIPKAQDAFKRTIDDSNKAFRELLSSQKEGVLTADELKKRYDLLYSENEKLTESYSSQAREIDNVKKQIAADQARVDGLSGNSEETRARRRALLSDIQAEQQYVNQLSVGLTNEARQQDLVNASLQRASLEYQRQIEYQKTLAYQFDRAGDAARKAVQAQGGNLLASGAMGFFNRVTGAGGRENDVSKLIGTYVSSYVNSMAEPLMKAIFPQLADKQGSKTQPVLDTQTYGEMQHATTAINSGVEQQKATNAKLDQVIENTAYGKDIQTNSDGTIPVAPTSPYADMSNASFGSWGSSSSADSTYGDLWDYETSNQGFSLDSVLKSRSVKTAAGAFGALQSTLGGMNQGGFGGALTGGLGTFESLSAAGVPPQVSIPAAVLSAGISLFSHHDDPQAMPDKYDTANYLKIQANLLGSGYNGKAQAQANGSTQVLDSQVGAETNNLGYIQYIQQWAQTNLASNDPATAKMAADLEKQWGTYNAGASGNQVIHYDKDIANEQIVGGTEAGTYTSIYTDAQTAAQSIQQLGQASLQAAQNAKALADSFTASIFGGPSGFTMPYLGSIAAGNASSTFLPSSAVSGATRISADGRAGSSTPGVGTATLSSTAPGDVHIRILEGATVSNADDVKQAIVDSIPMITNAVNQANYNQGRYMTDYKSQLS